MTSLPGSDVSLDSILGDRQRDRPAELVQRYLAQARQQLGMDVAYVAELRDGSCFYRYVDAETLPETVRVGACAPPDDTYAQRVVDGRLVGVVTDAAGDERVKGLPETREVGIGSFVGVPLRLSEGRVYGALCCFSAAARPSLDERDEGFLGAFASLMADQLESRVGEWDDLRGQIERIDRLLRTGGIEMVFQPIFDIRTRQVAGVEALARFPMDPKRPPNAWFDEAWTVGRGVDLELAAVAAALACLDDVPPAAYLALNVSPETAMSPRMREALAGGSSERVVLEVPERAPVADHYRFKLAVQELRSVGVRLAADDAGAGFENLSHILEIGPDMVKFDVALTRDVDTDPLRQSLASSMVSFAQQFDATVIAEGIETEGELTTLRDLGFAHGQGYHLARPGALALPDDRA